jgi:hypothetical protein
MPIIGAGAPGRLAGAAALGAPADGLVPAALGEVEVVPAGLEAAGAG